MSKTKTVKPKSARVSDVTDSLEIAGSEEQYVKFLPLVQKLDAKSVSACRADVHLAHHNVQLGADSVLSYRTKLRTELPRFSHAEIESIVDLSRAVVFSAARVDAVASPNEIRTLLAHGRHKRGLLLSAANSLAAAGLVPDPVVEKIRKGTGPIDVATDCVDLAALFTKYASVRSKTPVTAADVRESSEVGTKLLDLLKPRGTKRTRPVDVKTAANIRDRFWSLLLVRHDQLWRAGAFLFGRNDVDKRVPPLQSRAVGRRAKAPTAPAATPHA